MLNIAKGIISFIGKIFTSGGLVFGLGIVGGIGGYLLSKPLHIVWNILIAIGSLIIGLVIGVAIISVIYFTLITILFLILFVHHHEYAQFANTSFRKYLFARKLGRPLP